MHGAGRSDGCRQVHRDAQDHRVHLRPAHPGHLGAGHQSHRDEDHPSADGQDHPDAGHRGHQGHPGGQDHPDADRRVLRGDQDHPCEGRRGGLRVQSDGHRERRGACHWGAAESDDRMPTTDAQRAAGESDDRMPKRGQPDERATGLREVSHRALMGARAARAAAAQRPAACRRASQDVAQAQASGDHSR